MIIEAEIINQPSSGEYDERIYDNESPWNSQGWTWIKFTNDDYSEWCGEFRGFPRRVAISTVSNLILVLTSDYLFLLDRFKGNIIELEDQPQYHNLIVAPSGSFFISGYYRFEKITTSLKAKIKIESPIDMDMIEFKGWNGDKLEFTCDEFLNWDRHLKMVYDDQTDRIEIVSG